MTTEAHAAHAETHGGHHHEMGFIRKYIFSQDHKIIGIQFMLMSLVFILLGGGLALALRWQLAWPGGEYGPEYAKPVPILGKLLWSNTGGSMPKEAFPMFTTMHGTIMIFFVIIPLLVGAFGNFTVPLMIGAKDMAFPLLNMLSFWFALPAGIIMLLSFFQEGGAAAAGWTAYPTLSGPATWRGEPTGLSGGGQSYWLVSLIILGTSSIMGAINYLTTIINMRAPGMGFFRMPLTVWSIFITSILVLFATPVLASALGMLLFDRVGGTSFFLAGPKFPGASGQPLLWQHLFWFYSHPAVYIMILPAMGVVSDVLSTFSRKPIFGYKSMVFAIAGIAGLGYIVWGHHMFQSGMNPLLGTTFMVSTVLIAVPSAIKTFNWLGTLWGGSLHLTTPMLNALAFVSMFTIGGLSGVFMASTTFDIFIHDTYFIVAHLHYVLFGGSLFGIFAGIYYWYPKMFGRMMSERLGKLHFWLTFISYNLVFFPMHIIGLGGHPRRVSSIMEYDLFKPLQHWNVFMTYAALVLGAVQLIFAWNFIASWFLGKKADRNPWHGNTLEWTTPSPAPHGNFEVTPIVHRGPYEYHAPGSGRDGINPQTEPGKGAALAAH